MENKHYHLLASLICGDPRLLENELAELEAGGIDGIHFDVMDGHFVPRLGLYPEVFKAIKARTRIPVDIHLMVNEPHNFLPAFFNSGADENDVFVVHAESTNHLHHAVKSIRDAGFKAGVALNPATPLSVLDYILGDIDRVMLMAINPGILGHKLIPSMMDKIVDLKRYLQEYPHIHIEVDGGVSPESAASMVTAGATMLVCGTSIIYRSHEDTLSNKIREARAAIDSALSV